jgi:hypothetical protein
METVLILLIAAGVSAGVVWWASTPPGTPLIPRRRLPEDTGFSPTLRESFQTTGPEPAQSTATPPDDGFQFLQQAVADDRPPRILSVIRIIFAIGFVAALGVATLALLGLLVKLELDTYLGG